MRMFMAAAVAALSMSAGVAHAAGGTVILSGLIPDSLEISHDFADQPGGTYYLLTDAILASNPTFVSTLQFTNRYYVGKDGSVIPLPDETNDGRAWGFAKPWVEAIDGGVAIHQYGPGHELNRRICCFAGPGDPYFYTEHQDLWQDLHFDAKFVDGAAGQTFSLVYMGMVPEPATWAIMIAGFGMTGAALRRRRSLAA